MSEPEASAITAEDIKQLRLPRKLQRRLLDARTSRSGVIGAQTGHADHWDDGAWGDSGRGDIPPIAKNQPD